jgi:tRNA(Ile)-lysidine synthase
MRFAMLDALPRSIGRYALLNDGEPVWVAVSGGVDSMVLLSVLHRLGYAVRAIHIDHGLRGPESAADRALVESYCVVRQIPILVEEVDVKAEMERSRASTQMAARALRYAVFRRAVQRGPHVLAMAHHADDVVETMLMNLMQGMGLRGWQGIPVRSGPFIRPLVHCSRADILAYAQVHHVPFREDASNSDPAYLRARVRHELLPLMESLRPGARSVMYRDQLLARELDHLAKHRIAELVADLHPDEQGVLRIPFTMLRTCQAPHAVLRALLEGKGYHPDRIADMVHAMDQGKVGAHFPGDGVDLLVDRQDLLLVPIQGEPQEWTIHDTHDPPPDMPLHIGSVDGADIIEDAGPNVIWLDEERVVLPMKLRPWKAGDRLRPSGMKGSKLVSDVLIDAKVPGHLKDRTYVLCDATRILWCCGLRASEEARARASSARVLRLEWWGA